MSQNEQTESSAYLALGAFIRNRELLGLMASILPVEMMHYTAFQTSMSMLSGANALTGAGTGAGTGTGTGAGGTGTAGSNGSTSTIGTGPNAQFLGTLDLRAQANSIPLPILPAPAPVYSGMPNVSVIRPRHLTNAGAVATVNKLIAANYFQDQPATFLAMLRQMAAAADGATLVAQLSPSGITTSSPELTLSTAGSMGMNGSGLTYSLRSINGSATIINGNTPTPRVQFAGGPGPYTFELSVMDASGNTARDIVTIFYQGR